MVPKEMEVAVLDIQHMGMLSMQDPGVDHDKLLAGLRIQAVLLHDLDRGRDALVDVRGQLGRDGGGAVLACPVAVVLEGVDRKHVPDRTLDAFQCAQVGPQLRWITASIAVARKVFAVLQMGSPFRGRPQ